MGWILSYVLVILLLLIGLFNMILVCLLMSGCVFISLDIFFLLN